MKIRLLTMVMLFASGSLSAQQILVQDNGSKNNFCLVADGSVADLLIDTNDSKTVHLAVRLFSEDIERVSGQKTEIKKNVKSASSFCVIIGTIDGSSMIQRLI